MGVRAGPDWLRRNPIASGWAGDSPRGLQIIDKPRSKPKRIFVRAERRAGQTLTAWRSLTRPSPQGRPGKPLRLSHRDWDTSGQAKPSAGFPESLSELRLEREGQSQTSAIAPGCEPCGVWAHSSRHRASSQSLSAARERKFGVGCQSRWRASWTFFSICPFSQPEAGLQNSASNRKWLTIAEKRALT